VQAIQAARAIRRAADEAAVEITKVGNLVVPKGHQAGALSEWIAALLEIYERIAGRKPGTSFSPGGRNKGKAGGPLIRFLKTAGAPLDIKKSDNAWRSLIRGVLSRRQK
jgi:hypothetical protein